jgi:hypothetical protein
MSMENYGGILSTGENSFIHQTSLVILSAELPSSKAGGTGEGNYGFRFRSTFVHTSKEFF